MAKILGDAEADDRSFRQRGPRATKPGAIAQRINAIHVRAPATIAPRHQLTAHRIDIMTATQDAQQFVRRLEPIAQAQHVRLEAAPTLS